MPATKAQIRATVKYIAKKYDRIEFKVLKGEKAKIAEHATKYHGSVNKFMIAAIEAQMKKDLEDGTDLCPKE